jgi:hypothetical protein
VRGGSLTPSPVLQVTLHTCMTGFRRLLMAIHVYHDFPIISRRISKGQWCLCLRWCINWLLNPMHDTCAGAHDACSLASPRFLRSFGQCWVAEDISFTVGVVSYSCLLRQVWSLVGCAKGLLRNRKPTPNTSTPPQAQGIRHRYWMHS